MIEGHILGVAKYLNLKRKQDGVSVFVDGEQAQEDIIVNGETYAPVRAVAEVLGKTVGWYGIKKRVDIN